MDLEEEIPKVIDKLYKDQSELVKKSMSEVVFDFMYTNIEDLLEECKSPIELALGIKLKPRLATMQLCDFGGFCDLTPQYEITVNKKTYRADFLLELGNSTKEEIIKVVIECDGHDFHEKTKEQATRDKKRERDFVKAGYHVIRFSGSEIFKQTQVCVNEITSLCYTLTERWRSIEKKG